jgi:alpha-beta hydrolase superfamily lysophospholipase
MISLAAKGLKLVLIVVAAVLATLVAVRVWDSQRGPQLEPWHTYVPQEARAGAIDAMDWPEYVEAENRIFETVRDKVTHRLPAWDRIPLNRYFEGSPIYPGHFRQDWNRSFIIEPDGEPLGAVVLLHGLTDSPYSLRHIAEIYRLHGFVAVGVRLPGHGVVPAALTDVEWEDWMAATRLATREARRRGGPAKPLHIVGYSNGGALALKYALDALDDDRLTRPDRLILISPMIGVTRFARFAGLAALPAYFPAFAKAAWLDILPEFNPFKYNSFPVNAAVQSHRLTQVLQDEITNTARRGDLTKLPPLLTFQSVVDFTVSTPAVVSNLYQRLPPIGGELVLFDINRATPLGMLLRPSARDELTRLLPSAPRSFRTTVIANDAGSPEVSERVVEAGAQVESIHPLGMAFPSDVYSLSHIALPFPASDGLYGANPDPGEDFGIRLGSVTPRGERNVLVASLDSLVRLTSNPFFPYLARRIEECLPAERRKVDPSAP